MKNQQSPQRQAEANLKPLYTRTVISSFSSGMVNPFMSAYAVQLGATSPEMGWFQSSSNLSNNVMQVAWGRLSDRKKQRIPFIILGSLIVAALWIPIMFITTATQLIILLMVQALLGSMATPAWTALIAELSSASKLGRTNASIYLYTLTGSLVATLVSGILMVTIGQMSHSSLLIPLVIATVTGVLSSLVMLRVREKKNDGKPNSNTNFVSDIASMLVHVKENPDFIKYCYVQAVFQFSMAIAWPLLAITQIRILNASMLQIALLSVVQTLVTMIFQSWGGKLIDTVGRKPLFIILRFSLITVPLAYALVPDINILIAIGTFWGFTSALGEAAMATYLLDISPEEHRGSFIAIFNLIIGIATFAGSLLGGYLSDYTIGIYGLAFGLMIVYFVSTAGRGIGAVLHLTLKETLKK